MKRLADYMKKALAGIFLAGIVSTGASATTITFDTMPHSVFAPTPQIHLESGYQITPTNSFATFGSFGSGGLHLDVCCGPFSSGVQLSRVGGGLFSVNSLDLSLYQDTALLPPWVHFVSFTGFRNNVAVAALSGGSGLPGTLTFGSAFAALDRLVIDTLAIPASFDPFIDYHLDVDNIVVTSVAAVPLPAAIWSLLAGLGLLVSLKAVRRRLRLTGF